MPPFFGNATVAPTGWGRVQALVVDGFATFNLMTIRGSSSVTPGGLYMFDIGNGYIRRASHSADLSCDTSVAGPIIGGRDQAGAFGNNSWCYLYAVLKTADLATVGFIVSANAPSVGPSGLGALGYQSPLFCGAQRIGAAGTMVRFTRRGQWTNTEENISTFLVNTSTNPTAVQTTNATAAVPPTANEILVDCNGSNLAQTAVNQQGFLIFGYTTVGQQIVSAYNFTQVANQVIGAFTFLEVPFDGTNIYWNWNLTGTRASGTTQLSIARYRENL